MDVPPSLIGGILMAIGARFAQFEEVWPGVEVYPGTVNPGTIAAGGVFQVLIPLPQGNTANIGDVVLWSSSGVSLAALQVAVTIASPGVIGVTIYNPEFFGITVNSAVWNFVSEQPGIF